MKDTIKRILKEDSRTKYHDMILVDLLKNFNNRTYKPVEKFGIGEESVEHFRDVGIEKLYSIEGIEFNTNDFIDVSVGGYEFKFTIDAVDTKNLNETIDIYISFLDGNVEIEGEFMTTNEARSNEEWGWEIESEMRSIAFKIILYHIPELILVEYEIYISSDSI